jgi:hypothetical protein
MGSLTANTGENFLCAHLGQHEIQDDQVEVRRPRHLKAFGAVSRRAHREAGSFEALFVKVATGASS